MVTCADTSFLFSLYGNDVNTEDALAWLRRNSRAITVTVLNEFELGNALRFSEFKGCVASGDAGRMWEEYKKDREEGRVRLKVCNLAEVAGFARKLSEEHTLRGGHRSFDILHVAAARVCDADQFLTFDQNQACLSRDVGLEVCPGG